MERLVEVQQDPNPGQTALLEKLELIELRDVWGSKGGREKERKNLNKEEQKNKKKHNKIEQQVIFFFLVDRWRRELLKPARDLGAAIFFFPSLFLRELFHEFIFHSYFLNELLFVLSPPSVVKKIPH